MEFPLVVRLRSAASSASCSAFICSAGFVTVVSFSGSRAIGSLFFWFHSDPHDLWGNREEINHLTDRICSKCGEAIMLKELQPVKVVGKGMVYYHKSHFNVQ